MHTDKLFLVRTFVRFVRMLCALKGLCAFSLVCFVFGFVRPLCACLCGGRHRKSEAYCLQKLSVCSATEIQYSDTIVQYYSTTVQ